MFCFCISFLLDIAVLLLVDACIYILLTMLVCCTLHRLVLCHQIACSRYLPLILVACFLLLAHSTADLKSDPAKPFCFLMDASMLGVGVGFDTRGAGRLLGFTFVLERFGMHVFAVYA